MYIKSQLSHVMCPFETRTAHSHGPFGALGHKTTNDTKVGQWDVLNVALQELDAFNSGLALVLVRQREHLIRHVQPVGFPGRAYSFR